MSSYSGLERSIARLLSRFPAIKQFAKFCYSRLMYLKSKKSFDHRSMVKLKVITDSPLESFFGYYDKSPENVDGLVLALSTTCATKKLPSAQQPIELVVFSQTGESVFSVPVSVYNWQQGCRAHWLTDDLFFFNDFDAESNKYISKVFSVSKQEKVKQFAFLVQDSFETSYFVSLNYRRLMALRPDYGYRNLPNLSGVELNDLEADGLWRVDYETGEGSLLISIAQACAVRPLPEFSQAVHKFNHVMISPDGRQFIFMHRYFIGQRRFDRLLLADASTGALKLLSDYGMVSHCFWVDSNTVLGYMRGPSDKDGYWLLDVETGEFKPCLQDKLGSYGDGHPHVHGDWFVTDTYPDKARMQHLLLCNWKTGEVKELGEFFHGFEYVGETRCDLHPRFSPDGKAVFFDSVFTGQRQLYRMELPE